MYDEARELADSVEAAYRFGDRGRPGRTPYIDERSFAWHIAYKMEQTIPYSKSRSLRRRIRGEAEFLRTAAKHATTLTACDEARAAAETLFAVADLLDARAEATGEAGADRARMIVRKASRVAREAKAAARERAIEVAVKGEIERASALIPPGTPSRRKKVKREARRLAKIKVDAK